MRGNALLAIACLSAAAACTAPASTASLVPVPEVAAPRPRGRADARSAEVAELVLRRLGGEEAWERTRYASWRFFGRRRHLWDKWTGDVRIEDEAQALVVRMNVLSREGTVERGGEPVTDAAQRAELLRWGYEAWVNDSYWMFMPFKLRDPGTVLRWLGEDELPGGRPAWKLELTFEGVGVTPENRYVVWVGADTALVERWDFYRTAADPEPSLSTPWADWRPHVGTGGEIWLAGDRGRGAAWEISLPLAVDPATLAP